MKNSLLSGTGQTNAPLPSAYGAPAGKVRITELSVEGARLTGSPWPGYRRLYLLLLDGRLGVTGERIGHAWFVNRGDIGIIAETLGLAAKPPVSGARPRLGAAEPVRASA